MINAITTSHIQVTLGIISGLSIFLLGMKFLSTSFEQVVSVKFKKQIQRVTAHKFPALLIGTVATGFLQSSSATTVITIGLVHSRLLSLYNAIPIIMGANIGTTFTGQLIAFKITDYLPYLFILSLMVQILPSTTMKMIGKMLFSLSLIFIGIEIMSTSIMLLDLTKTLPSIIMKLGNNKLLSLCLGIALTAIIHSSSSSVALLQVMAASRLLPVPIAIPVILGQNIGTCVDALIGGMATNQYGKQIAFIHLLYNCIGVALFYAFTDELYQIAAYLSPDNIPRQIAHAHTLFNVTTTLLLLPFSNLLCIISKTVIPD